MVVNVLPVRVRCHHKGVLALGKTHGQFVAPPFLTVYILDTSVLFVMNIYNYRYFSLPRSLTMLQ